MRVQFKTTMWEQVTVPDSDVEKIVEKIRMDEIKSAEDLYNMYEDKDKISRDDMIETQEQMSLSDNHQWSTIEVLLDDEVVFGNGNEI